MPEMNNISTLLGVQTDWYIKQGYRVLYTKSTGWVEFAKGVLQAFPYHWVINPSEAEILELFRKYRLIALRYSTSLAASMGQISYHVIYEKPFYLLSSLPKKARHDVIKGLEHASYKPISMGELAFEGWESRYETLVRQGRRHAESREFWERMCLCADNLPGFESWGALHKGKLVASLLSYTLENTVSILYQQSKTDHLQFGVNNALTFEFTRTVLQRPGVNCIFYGLQSLDAPPGVDQYKFRMRYCAKPVRQRVLFNPLVLPVINHFSLSLIRKVHNIFPDHYTLNKAEGMMRFYLSGMRKISKQYWPEILNDQRDAILSQI